jgi:hypothetical protein
MSLVFIYVLFVPFVLFVAIVIVAVLEEESTRVSHLSIVCRSSGSLGCQDRS